MRCVLFHCASRIQRYGWLLTPHPSSPSSRRTYNPNRFTAHKQTRTRIHINSPALLLWSGQSALCFNPSPLDTGTNNFLGLCTCADWLGFIKIISKPLARGEDTYVSASMRPAARLKIRWMRSDLLPIWDSPVEVDTCSGTFPLYRIARLFSTSTTGIKTVDEVRVSKGLATPPLREWVMFMSDDIRLLFHACFPSPRRAEHG